MIISHKYKYLFIETPRTGSTAISAELCRYYDGASILRKHATYMEFEKIATAREKEYFVFSGVRNPLDDAVSIYLKLYNDHKHVFTDKKHQLKSGGFVTKKMLKKYEFVRKNGSFSHFLRRFYRIPYTSYINVNKCFCDDIIRFETINEDFFRILKMLNINPVRALPTVNPTENKSHYLEYYLTKDIAHVSRLFLPFITEFGYTFPEDWPVPKIRLFDKWMYEVIKACENYYCRFVLSGFLKNVRVLKELIG